MFRFFFFFLFLAMLCKPSAGSAQTSVLDSLYTVLAESTEYGSEKGIPIAQAIVTEAERNGDNQQILDAYLEYGRHVARVNNHYEEGVLMTEKGAQLALTELMDTSSAASALMIKGICHFNLNEDSLALDAYQKSINLALPLRDTNVLSSVYSNIASLYRFKSDFTTSEGYYRKALVMTLQKGNTVEIARAYQNIGYVSPNSDTALQYLMLAYGMFKEEEQPNYRMADITSDIGLKYLHREEPEKANPWFSLAYEYGTNQPDSQMYYAVTAYYSENFYQLGQHEEAQPLLEMAHSYFSKTAGLLGHINIKQALAENLAALGRTDEAYALAKEVDILQDSMFSDNAQNALAEANVKFETAESKATIAEQNLAIAEAKNSRNRLLFCAFGALILLAGIFQYFLQRNRLRRKELALEVDKRQAEAAQLREMDSLKTRFFTNISHELRTPLTLITSPLQEAINRLKQINLKPDLVLAHRNSQNLLTLVNEILDLSKLEAGQLSKKVATFAPDALLRRLFFAFESLAELRGITLDFKGEFPATERLTTDVGKLEKILNNLVSNALKFSPEGGTIILMVKRVEDVLEIAVKDEGPGIPSSEQEQVFQRYYQAANNTEHQTGTGIGLNLARKLARYLGGDLRLDSSPGTGSTFRLSLPVEVEQPVDLAILPPSTAPAAAVEPFGPIPPEQAWEPSAIRSRLLVVEDNPEMVDYLQRHLSLSYEVTTVSNGRAALAALSKQKFDLISSDVMMPEMDGFELRRRINEKREWRQIPFLLLTARNLEEDILSGFRLGVDDYITKPFSLPEYKARINNLLHNKDTRKKSLLAAPVKVISDADDLVVRAEALVRDRLADTTFTVEEMARELGHGQRQLSRLLGAATGLTPVRFILELRLQKARELLESRVYATVAEVRYEIGIESASYFTRKFTERFGKKPKELL